MFENNDSTVQSLMGNLEENASDRERLSGL
jgi:hypothetical protein